MKFKNVNSVKLYYQQHGFLLIPISNIIIEEENVKTFFLTSKPIKYLIGP